MVHTPHHDQPAPTIKPEWWPHILRGLAEAPAARVIDDYDIPYLCGYPVSGNAVFKDRHAPAGYFAGDGSWVDALKYWRIHERVEKNLLLAGLDYETAHPIAEFIEEQQAKADGVDLDDEYLAFCAKYVKEAGSERIKKTPRYLDLTPYRDENDKRDVDKIILAMDATPHPKKKAKTKKTVRAIHSNRGIEAAYRRELKAMIDEMTDSTDYWISAAYKKEPPRMAGLVGDASPSDKMKKTIAGLAKRWIKKFNDAAPKIAAKYIYRTYKYSDSAFMAALKASGFAVEFKMTPAMNDALNAEIAENVGLITNIPEKYYSQIEGIVMRSFSAGSDLQKMTRDLRALHPKLADRAVLIARDQTNKATAVTARARQLELGFKKAIWMHSHAGKIPRPDHVAADGKEFDIAKGCLISGEYILPGQLINCRCTSRAILP